MERPLESPTNRLGVRKHLLEGDRQGGGMAQHDHRQGITHQHHVGPRLLHQRGRQAVPGGQHRDRATGLLETDQFSRAHPPLQACGGPLLALRPTRTHAVQTPKPGQDRKGAATRDALGRRGLRVTQLRRQQPSVASKKSPVDDRAFF
ncbi:hypothetical protein RS9916_32857 [Synechococcus sp. RS9916]|nr:hypothetical protein RS9916_32857 [Synechococcus sp. RS9916]